MSTYRSRFVRGTESFNPNPTFSVAMAPTVADARIKLSYPLFAADFDPEDDKFLLVGGGGGEGRSGVGNKIVRPPAEDLG